MNKMLTKLTTTFIGMAMAIGVGIAVGSGVKKDIHRAEADNTTYTFTSKSWADSTSSWTSDNDGGQLSSGRGVQVTTTYSGAGAHSKSSFSSVSKIVFTYSTNADKGAGSISVQIGSNTAKSSSVTKSGGTTDRTLTFTYSTAETGAVTFTVTCTQNSIYVKSIAVETSGGGGGGTAPDGAAASNSFSTSKSYVLGATNSTTKYYLNGTTNGTLNSNADWGTCTTTEASGYRFMLSGSTSSDSTTIQATTVINNTTYYLAPLASGKFKLSSTSVSLTLKQDGTIYNPTSGSTGYNLRYNHNGGSGGFRWYNGTTGSSGYFYEAVVTYTIQYRANGGSGSMNDTTGTTVSAAACGFTRTGYTFSSWNTAADGSGTTYAVGAKVDADVILYAQWTINKYTLSYSGNGNDSGTVPASSEVNYNTEVTVSANTGSLAKTNYEFGGWNTQPDGNGTNYTAGSGKITITANTTLYAKWTLSSYTLTYNANGGSNAPAGDTVDVDDADSYTLAGLGSMSRENYTCDGWATSADGAKVYDLGESGVDLTQHAVDTAVTLYAHWVINSVAVTDDIEDGYPSVLSVDYGSTPEITIYPDDDDEFTYPASVTVTMGEVELEKGEDFLYENGVLRIFTEVTATLKISGSCREIFTVTADVENGGLDNEDSIVQGEKFEGNVITIDDPDEYTYPSSITITMGGDTLTAGTDYEYDPDSGVILSDIATTGDIVISGECELIIRKDIEVSLTNGSKKSGASKLYDGRTAELTLQANEHYKLPTSVEVVGATLGSYTQSTGVVVISNLVTTAEKVVISGSCVALKNNDIETTLTGVTADSGNATEVEEGSSVTLTFTANDNYALPETVTVTGAASYTWTKSTGKLEVTGGTSELISITINGVARALTSISLSSSSGSYTLGDEFVMPTVTANFNFGESENVTSSATATGSGLVNGIFTATGVKEITISYTYAQHTETATYTATVTAITPAEGSISKVTDASTLALNDVIIVVNETAKVVMTTDVPASGTLGTSAVTISNSKITSELDAKVVKLTLASGNATNGWALKNGSNYLYVPNNNNRGTVLRSDAATNVITIDASGNATIKASSSATGYLQYNSSTPRFSNYTSSQAKVQIYKVVPPVVKSLKWITAELNSGTYYQGDTLDNSYFTVTAHYDDGTTTTPTTDITVTNGYLENIGDNQVTISYSGKSCFVNVEAEERTAEYTGLSWAQGEYILIDGQEIDFSQFGTVTAEYDDGESPSATKAISVCTVAIYTKNGESYSKVGDDLSDGDVITSASHGKYLGVTYTETNTFTAYSSAPIYVVEEIEDVYEQQEIMSWEKVTSLNKGDIVTFVNEASSKVATSHSSNIINATAYDTSVSTDFYFEVGKVGDYYTFHNKDGYLGNHSTGTSGSNNAYLDSEIDTEYNKNYFTVTFNEGNVVIESVYASARKLQFNDNRFCFYGSNQSVVQLYKGTKGYEPVGDNIANTDVIAQKVVLEYAEHFNDVMECIQGGTTSNVSGKWSDLAEDFDNWFNNGDKDLTPEQVKNAFALFAYAYAVEGGDTLQDMLARYEYICAKYKLDDFLATNAERPAVAKRTTVLPSILVFNIANNGENILLVIATLTLVAFAFGGYTYFRKKKQF